MRHLILSIHTSTPTSSIALHKAGKLLATSTEHNKNAHSNQLLPMIDEVLSRCDSSLESLDAIAICTGPGSYTGLRVGAALAKGLCFANSLPLIGINPLVAMAHKQIESSKKKALWIPLLQATKERAYGMVIDSYKQLQTGIFTTTSLTAQTFHKWLSLSAVYFMGNAAEKHAQALLRNSNAHLISNIHPQASSMGTLAFQKALQTDFLEQSDFEPLY